MRADALVQFGSVSLNPAKQGGVIDLAATVSQHALEIAIADWKLQASADRPQNDLHREQPTLERVRIALLHHDLLSAPSRHNPAKESFKAATEPS
uniref:hypothetical protein n=1 Tax=Microvirga aerophila TaxID=670291 RepID=UPI001478AAF5|nr:hypothetical protein [Microvirga aerophila]